MMNRRFLRLAAFVILPLMALASCGSLGGGGGSGTGGKGQTPVNGPTNDPVVHAAYLGLSSARSNMFDRRRLLTGTAEQAIPLRGTATYAGVGSVAVDTPTGEFMALGDAALRLNFGNAMMTGTVENFVARDPANVEQAYTGTLQVLGAVGSGTMPRDRFAVVVAGSLSSTDHTIRVSNDLFGGFRGTDYGTIFATTNGGDTVTLDGANMIGRVQIIAEKQP